MRCKQNFLLAFFLSVTGIAGAQQTKNFNLFQLAIDKKLEPVHRTIKPLQDSIYKGVSLSQDTSEGIVWIKAAVFTGGTIEFDVRGKDELQKSFVGVAFYGQDDSSFDAIYFRPFNFHSKDSVRRIHSVQYVSHPLYTWKKLRDERNAEFEKAVADAPDPNGWFHAKVSVENRTVKVFINGRDKPAIEVRQLSNFSSGKIGLFAGDGSGGDFANLVIGPLTKK